MQEWGLWSVVSSSPWHPTWQAMSQGLCPCCRIWSGTVLLCCLAGLVTDLVLEWGPQISPVYATKLCWEMQLAELHVCPLPPLFPTPMTHHPLCWDNRYLNILPFVFRQAGLARAPYQARAWGCCRVPDMMCMVLLFQPGVDQSPAPSWAQLTGLAGWSGAQPAWSWSALPQKYVWQTGGGGAGGLCYLHSLWPLQSTQIYLHVQVAMLSFCKDMSQRESENLRKAVKKIAAMLKPEKHGQPSVASAISTLSPSVCPLNPLLTWH